MASAAMRLCSAIEGYADQYRIFSSRRQTPLSFRRVIKSLNSARPSPSPFRRFGSHVPISVFHLSLGISRGTLLIRLLRGGRMKDITPRLSPTSTFIHSRTIHMPLGCTQGTMLARVFCTLLAANTLTTAMPPLVQSTASSKVAKKALLGTADSLAPLIHSYAGRYGLDPALLQAVIKVESNFNPVAVSPKGALGLMQLMPPTAQIFHVVDPFDPDENIRAGASLLRRLLDRFNGDLSLALAAYHAGESRVSQYSEMSLLPSTQLYVDRVLNHYARFVSNARPSRRPYPGTDRHQSPNSKPAFQ